MRAFETLSDDDLYAIADRHPGWTVEYVAGQVVLSPPSGFNTGRRNAMLTALLWTYAEANGYYATDSSTGFRLPDGDVLAPDVALTRADRLNASDDPQSERIVELVPDIIVELRSQSDRGRRALDHKCERWFAAGAAYVALLDPFGETELREWGAPPPNFPDLISALRI